MGYTIAIAGKGGTGKTTIAALIIRMIKEKKLGSVLAVDADPNSNLGEVLGIAVKETIGSILDEIAAHPQIIPSSISKDRFIEYQVQKAIVEDNGFDLLTMGKPEGPGCYCYVNNVLRNIMGVLIKNYDYIIIDNEAGLEHLSRRTTRSADTFLIISDGTSVGLKAAGRIGQLINDLDIKTKRKFLLLNRFSGILENKKIKDLKLDYLGNIPYDEELIHISLHGSSLMHLDGNAVSISALRKIKDKIWQEN
jgi:CO dehydrogenase maturation factor